VHDGTHTHYLTSAVRRPWTRATSTTCYEHLVHHGYGAETGSRVVLLANRVEVKTIRHFRVADGDDWDFIPAQGSPAQILGLTDQIVGAQVAATLEGLTVAGTYGNVIVVEENTVPAGHMAMISTGGQNNLNNPVGIREHQNASLRGLRLVKGPSADYPLTDSFYNRGFGTGVRHRGGSVIMQIKASGSYAPPAAYAALV
jgi:hypothetical protein